MKRIFQDQDVTRMIWLCLLGNLALLTWQFLAYLTGKIPEHILPLVILLSGTQECVPMAYSWTLKLGLLSILGILFSIGYLILQRIVIKK